MIVTPKDLDNRLLDSGNGCRTPQSLLLHARPPRFRSPLSFPVVQGPSDGDDRIPSARHAETKHS